MLLQVWLPCSASQRPPSLLCSNTSMGYSSWHLLCSMAEEITSLSGICFAYPVKISAQERLPLAYYCLLQKECCKFYLPAQRSGDWKREILATEGRGWTEQPQQALWLLLEYIIMFDKMVTTILEERQTKLNSLAYLKKDTCMRDKIAIAMWPSLVCLSPLNIEKNIQPRGW